jgi:hypothetical protein
VDLHFKKQARQKNRQVEESSGGEDAGWWFVVARFKTQEE